MKETNHTNIKYTKMDDVSQICEYISQIYNNRLLDGVVDSNKHFGTYPIFLLDSTQYPTQPEVIYSMEHVKSKQITTIYDFCGLVHTMHFWNAVFDEDLFNKLFTFCNKHRRLVREHIITFKQVYRYPVINLLYEYAIVNKFKFRKCLRRNIKIKPVEIKPYELDYFIRWAIIKKRTQRTGDLFIFLLNNKINHVHLLVDELLSNHKACDIYHMEIFKYVCEHGYAVTPVFADEMRYYCKIPYIKKQIMALLDWNKLYPSPKTCTKNSI